MNVSNLPEVEFVSADKGKSSNVSDGCVYGCNRTNTGKS